MGKKNPLEGPGLAGCPARARVVAPVVSAVVSVPVLVAPPVSSSPVSIGSSAESSVAAVGAALKIAGQGESGGAV